MTTFSIIMPAYNAEKYIRESIESVISQTYKEWELIIVDDGSKDDTYRIANEYAQQDKRIKVITQSNSGTAAAARNTALKYVSGEYTQMLDSDDYLSDDYLEKLAKVIDIYDLDIIVGIAKMVNDNGADLGEVTHASRYNGTVISGKDAFKLSLTWGIHGWLCEKTELINKIKYDPQLINGDELTTRKLYYFAENVGFFDGTYFYRNNAESTTHTSKNKARIFECLLTDYNIYAFVSENSANKKIVNDCVQKLCKSLIAHQAKAIREKKVFSNEDIVFIERIIHDSLQNISNIEFKGKGIWSFIVFRIIRNKRQRLITVSKLYNLIRYRVQEEQ